MFDSRQMLTILTEKNSFGEYFKLDWLTRTRQKYCLPISGFQSCTCKQNIVTDKCILKAYKQRIF